MFFLDNLNRNNIITVMFQKTIKRAVSFSGIGLHTGKKTSVTLEPAMENTGVVFNYNDSLINVTVNNIYNTTRSIGIRSKNINITTVEHLLAAIYMCGITNLIIKIDNKEVPALDGSAGQFLKLIIKAGFINQDKQVKPIILSSPIGLIEENKIIMAMPCDRLKITYSIDFKHPDLHDKSIHFDKVDLNIFQKNIAPARTFGFYKEVSSLLKKGLVKGGNLKNAVVLTDDGYLNKKLRFPDECIRHKVLDFIGALAFLNRPVIAHFFIYKSGHEFDLKFIKKIRNA